ncbi:RNA 2',3'-cyclic phosphodiesterase [Candidatus Gracilibacteria bacterium]|nr:RNA 2',3'-cyclic phosphodiesterase [Candidatus Gracilibacteria bacterium]MCF7819162.1 RNA 2',3'-cyclic phosphodiesterase [Candidatus Gracilibacteria bacterium]
MTPQRLFLAIRVPEKLKKSFVRFQEKNTLLEKSARVRWTPAENFHVTLFFLGNVLPHHVPSLTQTLHNFFEDKSPFLIEFERFCIREPHDPRMIWARFQDNENFVQLSQKTFHTCRKYLENKIPPRHKQIPHVTVARMKKTKETALSLEQTSVEKEKILIDHAELWLSEQRQEGAKYRPLAHFSFSS